jgi:hypothetical protein
MVNPVR